MKRGEKGDGFIRKKNRPQSISILIYVCVIIFIMTDFSLQYFSLKKKKIERYCFCVEKNDFGTSRIQKTSNFGRI